VFWTRSLTKNNITAHSHIDGDKITSEARSTIPNQPTETSDEVLHSLLIHTVDRLPLVDFVGTGFVEKCPDFNAAANTLSNQQQSEHANYRNTREPPHTEDPLYIKYNLINQLVLSP